MFAYERFSESEQTLNSQSHLSAIYEGYHETGMQ